MTTEAIVTVLEDLRENVMHIRKDVDLLKGIFLENKKSDFVKLI